MSKKIAKTIELGDLKNPEVIKTLDFAGLNDLCSKIRGEIIKACSINGGHLSPNLGVVELTTAIFHHYNLPEDKLIFDVGHQSYTEKILSGRTLEGLRTSNGTDGFQKRSESEFDSYESGHSSNSISAAMGMALARDLKGENYNIITVIGDSSVENGLAYEALNNLAGFKHKIIVIINDNEMSITKPVGGIHKLLSSIKLSKGYHKSKDNYSRIFQRKGFRWFFKMTSGIKNFFQRHLYPENFFEQMGLYYYGIVNGHNIKALEKAFKKIDKFDRPVILHVKTVKGKGYEPAEKDKYGHYHAVPPFNPEVGVLSNPNQGSWSSFYAECLANAMREDKEVVAIHPATGYGSDLLENLKEFPNRCYDVGISEEHSVVFANGLSVGGMKPYVTVYSTFLQRAYDEIHHDVARMDGNVTILVDRVGLVGGDGETHNGIYDVAYFSSIPNMSVAMARNDKEAAKLFAFSRTFNHPLAIRYPKTSLEVGESGIKEEITLGQWDVLNAGADKAVISYGPAVEKLSKTLDKSITIIDALFQMPINIDVLKSLLNYKTIYVYDPYGTEIGFASSIKTALYDLGFKGELKVKAIPMSFVERGTTKEQETRVGVSLEQAVEWINE
ncbi:MAG: 1-deoxy-D-xylulose-5-phosphate synthase [Bacilli bacterium]|nr:1-deoxy-D-xylulose-5-phosphate synthase [Bacilli bacterium]